MGNLIIQHFSTPAQAAGPGAVLLTSPHAAGLASRHRWVHRCHFLPPGLREGSPADGVLHAPWVGIDDQEEEVFIDLCSGRGRVGLADSLLLQGAHTDGGNASAEWGDRSPWTQHLTFLPEGRALSPHGFLVEILIQHETSLKRSHSG